MQLFRSILAILAGIVTIVALSTATDVILESNGLVPPPEQQAAAPQYFYLFAAYRFLYTVIGAYVTARLAPSAPMTHGLILGAIGTALGALGAVVMRGKGPEWYALALPITAIPLCWLGARLAPNRQATRIIRLLCVVIGFGLALWGAWLIAYAYWQHAVLAGDRSDFIQAYSRSLGLEAGMIVLGLILAFLGSRRAKVRD